MNKTTKWIYAGLLCILLGAALIVTAGSMTAWDFKSFGNTYHLTAQTFEIDEPFTAIDVRDCGGDVTLLPAEDGRCTVTAGVSEESGVETVVEVRGGVLYVERKDTRSWSQRISFNVWTGEDAVTVRLPEERLAVMELRSGSSDVTVDGSLFFGRFSASCSSGRIDFLGAVEKKLSLKTGSGDILLADCACGSAALESSSGGIQVRNLQCGDFESRSTSGDQRLENLEAAGDLTAESGSGKLTLRRVKAGGALRLKSTSGDVDFEKLDAASVEIHTTSGEVEGTAARRMDFSASSSSGSIRIPEPDPKGGAFSVRTSSGDIKIKVG